MYALFNQLETRVRHNSASVFEKDAEGNVVMEAVPLKNGMIEYLPKQIDSKLMMLVTSNPSPGWIRTKLLYETPHDQLHYYGDDAEIRKGLYAENVDKNVDIATYVVPSTSNIYLPKGFLESISRGKTEQ